MITPIKLTALILVILMTCVAGADELMSCSFQEGGASPHGSSHF